MRCSIILLIILSSHCGFSHGNLIKGSVNDGTAGIPLQGATAVLNNGARTITTDVLGNFHFDNLADGKYSIRITHIGYASQVIEVTLASEETRIINVSLLPAVLELGEVTIGGAPDHALTTISKIDIELGPIRSSQDVLRVIPGLVTAQHAGGGKAEQIFLRGFDIDHGTDISLSVDGMPVNMVSHAHGQGYADLHFVIPEAIDHVDFNKGPYYANVGDFNTAGYANFNTRDYLDQSLLKLEAGRFDTWRTVTMLNLLDNKQSHQHAYVAAEYSFTNGPFISPQNFNRINLFGKFRGRIGDDKLLELSLSTFSSKWDASGQIPERAISGGLIDRFGAIDDTEGGLTGRTNINLMLTKIMANGGTVTNQLYFSLYDFDLYSNFTFFLHDSINGDAIRQRENRKIYGYTGTYNRDLKLFNKSISTQSGFGLRYDKIEDSELSHVKKRRTFVNAITRGDIDQINVNLFAEASWNPVTNLTISAGLRLDGFSFQYVNELDNEYDMQTQSAVLLAPKLNLFYNVTPDVQLYLKNAVGFHSNDARVVVIEGAKSLPKAYGTDVGVFAKPFKNTLMNFAFWRLKLQQEFVYVGDEAVVEMSGETMRYGADLSLRHQFLAWLFADFDVNYAFARALGEPEGENYIPLAPQWTTIGGLSVRSAKGITGSLRYRYVDQRPANEDNTVQAKGYFLLDASLHYTRNNIQFSVNATNLLNADWNEAQFDTETRLPGEVIGVSELTFTPGDPLFIKAGISFFF